MLIPKSQSGSRRDLTLPSERLLKDLYLHIPYISSILFTNSIDFVFV